MAVWHRRPKQQVLLQLDQASQYRSHDCDIVSLMMGQMNDKDTL
ncbi:MAG: hypothetical protein ACKE9I_00405 [Methylophagaceae bacterium]